VFVAPVEEVMTVLCAKHEPIYDTLSGTGRLQLQQLCKVCESGMFIQSHATIVSNQTNKDVIPPISLEYDCCDSTNRNFKLNRLRLHLPLEGVAGSPDDLKIVNHKVEDVDRLLFENDRKFNHFTMNTRIPSLSFLGMMTGLTMTGFCYCCCLKCCCRRCLKFSKWWKDNNPCTTIIFNPRIVTSIRSPGEIVRDSESRASGRSRRSLTEDAITSKVVGLNTDKSTMPTGKR